MQGIWLRLGPLMEKVVEYLNAIDAFFSSMTFYIIAIAFCANGLLGVFLFVRITCMAMMGYTNSTPTWKVVLMMIYLIMFWEIFFISLGWTMLKDHLKYTFTGKL